MGDGLGLNGNCKIHGMPPPPPPPIPPSRTSSHPLLRSHSNDLHDPDGDHRDGLGHHSSRHIGCSEVAKALDGVRFIAEHTRREEESVRVSSTLSE